MLAVSGFSLCYFGLLLTGKEIGIFIVSIVWKLLREITAFITMEVPGKVKKLGEFDYSWVYLGLLKDNRPFSYSGDVNLLVN